IDDASPSHVRRLLEDRNVEDTSGINRSSGALLNDSLWNRAQAAIPLLRLAPAPMFPSRDDASGWIYYVFLLSPPLALLALWFRRPPASEALKVISLSVLCLLLHQFMIRGSIDSRLPDVAGPTAVLLAWLARVAMDASARVDRGRIWTGRAIFA